MLKRRLLLGLVPAVVLARSTLADTLPVWAGELSRLRLFLLSHCFRDFVASRKPSGAVAEDGAVRQNSGGKLVLEEQAAGLAWIQYGLVHDDVVAIRQGWKVFDWGLRQQQPNGSFPSANSIHQTTRFLEALVCGFAIGPGGASAGRLASLALALDWLNKPEQRSHAEQNNVVFTHRAWMRASLFQIAGTVFGRANLLSVAAANAGQAMAQQRQDGAYPERGGPDVGYHIFGMMFQQHWLAALPPGPTFDNGLASLDRALDWYVQKIDPDGVVDRSGSTRMGVEVGKDIRYSRAIAVMLGAALLTGKSEWVEWAIRLGRGASRDGQIDSRSERALSADERERRHIVLECTTIP